MDEWPSYRTSVFTGGSTLLHWSLSSCEVFCRVPARVFKAMEFTAAKGGSLPQDTPAARVCVHTLCPGECNKDGEVSGGEDV